ncbi:MAG: hypothetical protein RBT67_13765 [Thauera sp.]|jgi:hypothetical protein|nr:hypothetical protein [Thauera sp.]
MTTHQYRLDAEDAVRAKEMGHAEARPRSETTKPYFTKKDTIRAALRLPRGLNRFEAERHGDHCLNSTIAELRADGCVIHSEWETVPTRFNSKGVRVLRYWLTGYAGG